MGATNTSVQIITQSVSQRQEKFTWTLRLHPLCSPHWFERLKPLIWNRKMIPKKRKRVKYQQFQLEETFVNTCFSAERVLAPSSVERSEGESVELKHTTEMLFLHGYSDDGWVNEGGEQANSWLARCSKNPLKRFLQDLHISNCRNLDPVSVFSYLHFIFVLGQTHESMQFFVLTLCKWTGPCSVKPARFSF